MKARVAGRCNVKVRVVIGKWYVIDRFPGRPGDPPAIVAGPFDTERQANREACESNIAGDLYIAKCSPKSN